MSEINLTQEFDASVWVDEWMKAIKNDRSIATSKGTMLGWFANAIMAGYDKARAERDEWRADAERLAEDYWGVEGLATYCIHCSSSASFYANIPHDANCPITLHRQLVAKYGQVVDK